MAAAEMVQLWRGGLLESTHRGHAVICDEAGAVVQALGVQRMAIGPQIDPGVPWTSVDTPLCPGEQVHVALKSGNFGSTDFFTKAFAQLSSMP